MPEVEISKEQAKAIEAWLKRNSSYLASSKSGYSDKDRRLITAYKTNDGEPVIIDEPCFGREKITLITSTEIISRLDSEGVNSPILMPKVLDQALEQVGFE